MTELGNDLTKSGDCIYPIILLHLYIQILPNPSCQVIIKISHFECEENNKQLMARKENVKFNENIDFN